MVQLVIFPFHFRRSISSCVFSLVHCEEGLAKNNFETECNTYDERAMLAKQDA